VAPALTAESTASPSAAKELFAASTSISRQPSQIARAICRSSDISVAQPPLLSGSGVVWPSSLSLRKQPLALVHAGRSNSLS
jgi:hypothetical protein